MIKIFEFIGSANKYFDEKQPWILAKEDKDKCNEILFNCCNIIYNVNTLLKPYLPISCDEVDNYLNIKNNYWKYDPISNIKISDTIIPLYERYDKKRIDEEIEALKNKIR